MEIPDLTTLPLLPYIDSTGNIPPTLEGKVGVYAIFDRDNKLEYVGISRDIVISLKQHLVRVPDRCYGVKVWIIATPDRTLLNAIQTAWSQDYTIDSTTWEKPIDCKQLMTATEQASLSNTTNELEVGKILKNVARRIEQEILTKLTDRGVSFEVRFNPKRKEEGLLDLKGY